MGSSGNFWPHSSCEVPRGGRYFETPYTFYLAFVEVRAKFGPLIDFILPMASTKLSSVHLWIARRSISSTNDGITIAAKTLSYNCRRYRPASLIDVAGSSNDSACRIERYPLFRPYLYDDLSCVWNSICSLEKHKLVTLRDALRSALC